MMSRIVSGLVGCAVMGFAIIGCSGVENSETDVASMGQALVGVDEFLYFRCNATGFDASSTNRLSDADDDGLFTVDFDVNQSWMVTGGDQCVVTRTNSASGWGTESATFGSATSNVVTPPAQWSIGAVDSTPATVRYPALGRYRATVNWEEGTVSITPVATQPAPLYYYLRCNATNWNVESSNRMVADGDVVELSYNVNQSWMVSDGDQCIVTRTNQLDGWGTTQVALGPSKTTRLVVPSGNTAATTVVSAGQYFSVRYPALGRYEARLNPVTGELRIGTFGPDAPETGLHGSVESLGGDRVRVTYDFQNAQQLIDFAAFDPNTAALSIVNGRLVVQNVAADGLVAAQLTKGFKVDSMTYQAELLSGDHVNVYVGTVPDGSWNPSRGYGAIHNSSGQLFAANGGEVLTSSTLGVATGTVYSGRIDTTEAGLTWTLDGSAESLAFPYYGGTSRTIALGGYASTVAFDNVVLEGTVEGFESDGVEIDPAAIHGAVENLADGRVRISYNFSDEQQKFDFVPANDATRRELNDGRLIVSSADASDLLKVALTKYNVRVDHVAYNAEVLAGDHVNVYMNTIWDGGWAPAVGCGGIHRNDGRLLTFDGSATATTDTTPIAARTPYVGEISLEPSAVTWSVNDVSVSVDSACYAGTDGALGLGGYDSDIAFDGIVIEGTLE